MVQWCKYNMPNAFELIKIKELKLWKIKKAEIVNMYTTLIIKRDD